MAVFLGAISGNKRVFKDYSTQLNNELKKTKLNDGKYKYWVVYAWTTNRYPKYEIVKKEMGELPIIVSPKLNGKEMLKFIKMNKNSKFLIEYRD